MSFLGNAFKDLKGVVNPRNYVRAGGELVHHPLRFGKDVGMQYVHLAEHPVRSFEDHPLNTLLELAPLGKVASLSTLGRGAVEAGEGASARIALMRAATQSARMRSSIGGLAETPMAARVGTDFTLANKVTAGAKQAAESRAKNASAMRRTLDEPTQWGATKSGIRQPDMNEHMLGTPLPGEGPRDMYRVGTQAYLNGEKMPNTAAGHDRFVSNRAVEYYAKQPEYQPKPMVNESPASPSDLFSRNRELFDLSHEGRSAANTARENLTPLGRQPLDDLMRQLEDAHARGNLRVGDEIANHIMRRFHFDPYAEDPPTFHGGYPSHPPKGAPDFMRPYSVPNKALDDAAYSDQKPYGPGSQRSDLVRKLLQQQMHQRPYRPKHRPSSN